MMHDVILPKCESWQHSREQAFTKLKALYGKGYRYVARDKDSIYVHCYSLHPKKYRDLDCWGYADPDAPEVLPVFAIRNIDLTEISWSNRSAALIEGLIFDSARGAR